MKSINRPNATASTSARSKSTKSNNGVVMSKSASSSCSLLSFCHTYPNMCSNQILRKKPLNRPNLARCYDNISNTCCTTMLPSLATMFRQQKNQQNLEQHCRAIMLPSLAKALCFAKLENLFPKRKSDKVFLGLSVGNAGPSETRGLGGGWSPPIIFSSCSMFPL